MAGVISGYDGLFEFKEPGQEYEDTPYVGMRVVRVNPVGELILCIPLVMRVMRG